MADREALARKIKQRPKRHSLIQNNYLKEGGVLAQSRDALKKQQTRDQIAHHLESRQGADQVKHEAGLDTDVAPTLQATARKLERGMISNKLTRELEMRPVQEEQSIKSLMKAEDVAPGLRAQKLKLEKQFTKDKVGHLIETRASKNDLTHSHILQGGNVADTLQGVQRKLEQKMTADKVGHLLEQRQDISELQHQGVLHDTAVVAPAIQGAQNKLEKNLAKSNLYHGLKYRPSIIDLKEKGIYKESELAQFGVDDEFEEDESSEYDYEEDGVENAYYEQKQAQAQQQYQEQSQPSQQQPAQSGGYARRSRNFHLTRLLLKFVSILAGSGEISLEMKATLKDLIVDQDENILAAAAQYDADNELEDFQENLVYLAQRFGQELQ